jgi:hypothetical protein
MCVLVVKKAMLTFARYDKCITNIQSTFNQIDEEKIIIQGLKVGGTKQTYQFNKG